MSSRYTAPEPTRVTANGIDVAALAVGERGPLALCLHGFPDTAHTWRHLMPELARAGYRAVAPFLRGYAPTAVPADGDYSHATLVADALGLHEAFGGDESAVIIGHDWGAGIATAAAMGAPDRWSKVVTMAVPPGGSFGRALLTQEAQMKRSWYMFFFQIGLADAVVAANDLAFLDMIWRDWSPGYDATEDLQLTKESLRAPENLAAALGYYRALFSGPALAAAASAGSRIPQQPMLYLHGRDDGCIGVEVADSAAAEVSANVRIDVIDGAGHFVHLERPDVVNSRIVEFLA